MQIISLIAQKGGTGKTTLSLSLAVAAHQAGRTVAIIDLDPQASATNWADRREEGAPVAISAQASRLQSVIDTARKNGVDMLIIDTPPKSESASLAAARAADLILVPCRPQIYDLETIPATKEIINLAGDTPALVVLNAVPPQGRRHEESVQVIQNMGLPVASKYFVQRAAFGDAPNAGLTALEYDPDGKAASEIRELYRMVSHMLDTQVSEDKIKTAI
ncbi:AAA family ATPase [Nitrospina watsonii]|uniref:Chromosome partitioning protein n=1 Tax=Nitrospina watsonii TaxID=1323948 RepID=A0ABM9HBD3_9BACT|nr:AAA family ATPase [Nitrospina watsonii]CAI2717514.1 Chromosome partitioning protein [Nitrospina watsonii]